MKTQVVVIGGGVTGAGVARDLSIRGIDVTLVEKGRLAGGTSGHSHGLLHSGARYAVEDEESARECIKENRTLKRIAADCIRDTGGYFLKLEEDEDEYFEKKLQACEDCGISAQQLDGGEFRNELPQISDNVEGAIEVPDASVDPVRLTVANAVDARQRGAELLTGTEVVDFEVGGNEATRVKVETGSGIGEIEAEHVVNAAGAWSGEIADMVDIELEMKPTKGVMLEVEKEVGAVINRCRPPSSGDIVVPRESTSVLGTTSVEVSDPGEYEKEEWEVEKVVEECAEMIPSIRSANITESYWGVRPLYVPDSNTGGRDASRDFFVLDHSERDGVEGITSVVGGKLTTYRLMAEKVSDLVCEKLGFEEGCRTHEERLLSDSEASVDGYLTEFCVSDSSFW